MKPRDKSLTWYPNTVVLYKDDIRQDHTELFYPTMEKAREIANFLNELMPKYLRKVQYYAAEKTKY